MKLKICLLSSFLFISLFISVFPLEIWSRDNEFMYLEDKVLDEADFIENGVKSEYYVEMEIEEATKKMLNKLEGYYPQNKIEFTKGCIKVQEKDFNINVSIYSVNNETKVETVMTNFSKEKKILNLKKDLSLLQLNTSYKPLYFQYVKGRIINTEVGLKIIENEEKLKDISALDVHNGYVGTASLFTGERVNFAVSNYDKGTYLVIGTPIIFSTY